MLGKFLLLLALLSPASVEFATRADELASAPCPPCYCTATAQYCTFTFLLVRA